MSLSGSISRSVGSVSNNDLDKNENVENGRI